MDHVSRYVEDRVELIKIEAREEIAVVLTKAVILFVMLKFLLDNNILSDVRIGLFRFFLIQLFYISLIYFGCKLGKK